MVADNPPATQASEHDALRVISLIDLTDLDDEHRPDGIDRLVERAVEHGTAAVCLWPEFVQRAAALRADAPDGAERLAIATVVNFPSGDSPIADVVDETRTALAHGADEIDVVLPYRALLEDRSGDATAMIEAVADAIAAKQGAHLKVILETGELPDSDTIRQASELAITAGADFIKTSTGKTAVGATVDAVSVMADAIAESERAVGLKPSGGIRTVDDALRYLAIVDDRLGANWATPETFRFGASGLLDDALDVLRHR